MQDIMSLHRFLLRHRSPNLLRPLSWTSVVLPALAVSLAAAAWLRRPRSAPRMPRLPVRHTPTPRGADGARVQQRLQRLQAPAPDVALPHSFWDAELDEEDDPAEIPTHGLSCVSEASQSAALFDPGEREETGVLLHW
jgi:hypothetical protein